MKTAKAQRPGLPAATSIVSAQTFRSPKGKIYRIIKTNESDAYDKPVPSPAKRKRRRA